MPCVLLCKKVMLLGYVIELLLEMPDFLAVLAVDEALLPFRLIASIATFLLKFSA